MKSKITAPGGVLDVLHDSLPLRQSQAHSLLQAGKPLHRLGSQYHVLVFKLPFNWRQRARP
eukprot:3629655-Pleurochrysis_carterae.AAC.1